MNPFLVFESFNKFLNLKTKGCIDSADFQAIHFVCFITNYEVLYRSVFGNKTTNTSETASSLNCRYSKFNSRFAPRYPVTKTLNSQTSTSVQRRHVVCSSWFS